MTEAKRLFTCQVCSKSYARACHLLRHRKSHTEESDFRCPFCHDKFSRSDAARRHSKTCNRGAGRPLPSTLKPGRRFHACDGCAISKSGCDGRYPCSTCAATKQLCTYNRVLQSLSVPKYTGQERISDLVLGSRCSMILRRQLYHDQGTGGAGFTLLYEPAEPESDVVPVFFLLQYTNPQNGRIQDYFGPGAKSLGVTAKGSDLSIENNNSVTFTSTDLSDWCWNDHDEFHVIDTVFGVESSVFNQTDTTRADTDQQLSLGGNLETTMSEITSALLATSMSKVSFTTYYTLLESAECIFSAEKASSFVDSYFDNWHPHCPILHQCSFDINSAHPPLLAALILMGAVFSSGKTTMAARICLDAMEEYIFGHADFIRLIDQSSEEKPGATDIAPLQASFIITIIQHWDTHSESRRRIRLHRFPDIVRAARNLGLTSLRHSHCAVHDKLYDYQDSQAFVKTEESIRLMNWIFLVDSSHAIFHRSLPQLELTELTGALPCPENVFNTQTLRPRCWCNKGELVYKIPSTADGIDLLMDDSWTNDTSSRFGQLGYLDLFILVSGLHEIIFRTDNTYTPQGYKSALRRALGRWRYLWDVNLRNLDSVEEGCLGFFRKADEYWCLANLLLKEDCPKLKRTSEGDSGQDCMDGVHEFLKRFSQLSIASF
ncbi:hypothetical protein EDB81DRAFT_816553 [Dactylonectria macrodidyma]|uniref:Zn(2)-C6 fungal-type domain-containing protein n=1 Tax=Dactylonectria macrodidyma TaxID=307937 RepID=A0A9P9IF10_9HYPO|nr:hypothetical protein EDB81DRAFT_816553 [Dactylonectria macrodidyma]